ncbi:CDKN2A-interacting protein [Tachyglossus aculeatus]|uniref:CDKN2A-interacting protein n=1 Tax=Tachyglossus aculeatus TaxID=9261 RepID=UPI0018F3142C|nr:CDKN2A-interacting protein [Tachyglossus aculeatus]
MAGAVPVPVPVPGSSQWAESLRADGETDKQWRHRRQFLLRNAGDLPGPPGRPRSLRLQRLVSYSLAWANHVFLGCRYPPSVMEKILRMAEGIQVTDAPAHTTRDELVAKVKKRELSSSNEGLEEPGRKRASPEGRTDAPTPKAGAEESGAAAGGSPARGAGPDAPGPAASEGSPGAARTAEPGPPEPPGPAEVRVPLLGSPDGSDGEPPAPGPESAAGPPPAPKAGPEPSGPPAEAGGGPPSAPRSGSPAGPPLLGARAAGSPPAASPWRRRRRRRRRRPRPGARPPWRVRPAPPRRLTHEDVKQKQPFFNRLYKTVAWKLVAAGGFGAAVNPGELLAAAVEALKATLDVAFVPLKELADLPQGKGSQESVVCELRCQSVYLGTGCGKSRDNARAVASREALKLFLKKRVVVKICKRRYRGGEIEDLVLLDEEARPAALPPALRHPQDPAGP